MKTKWYRLLHGLFFVVAALMTLAVLFYAEEDWRGARAWAAAKRELQAKGESLEWRDFIPPPVPDDQNLAMAPLFARMFRYQIDPKTRQLTFNHQAGWTDNETYQASVTIPWGKAQTNVSTPLGYGNWMNGHRLDLSRVQEYYRRRDDFPQAPQLQAPADDVLLALTRYSPQLDELAQAAATRPQTRFPVNWTQQPTWGIVLPHYGAIQGLTQTLRLRCVAELATGQTPAARRDIALMLRLRQAMENDPCLVAGLVDATCLNILIQPIWEGLAARQWTAEDLDALRESLLGINMLREYQRAMRGGEQAGFAAQLANDLQDRSQARELVRFVPLMSGEPPPRFFFSLRDWLWKLLPYVPRGWYEQNMATSVRCLQTYAVEAVDPANRRVALAQSEGFEQAMQQLPLTPSTFLAKEYLPTLAHVVRKFAQMQTIVDEAATACALEKYYLDHHAYPTTLAALVPEYLDRVPNDVMDGAPLRYRLTVDGRYQLYSIGVDGVDGGGVIAWPPDRKWRRAALGTAAGQEQKLPSPRIDKGDWVWQYAPAEPPDSPDNESRLESLPR